MKKQKINVENELKFNEATFTFNFKGKTISVTYSPTGEAKSEWYVKIELVGVGILSENIHTVHTIAQRVARLHIQDFFNSLHE